MFLNYKIYQIVSLAYYCYLH